MRTHLLGASLVCLLASLLPAGAWAKGTAAGSTITNTASAAYTDASGTARSVNSNPTSLKVDEVLNVTVVSNDAGDVSSATPQTSVPLSFTVTNTGNGTETYVMNVKNNLGGDQFDPSNTKLYLHTGNSPCNPATDTPYTPGANDPVLAADQSVVICVISDIPTGLATGSVGLVSLTAESLIASSVAGVSPPGTTFPGKGPGGIDAVAGASSGQVTVQNGYVISMAQATLTKSLAVSDPFGGTNPIPGATVTYTLVFNATGTGSLTGVKVIDAIPTGTTYVSPSMTLDGVALTDVIDTDAGVFNGGQIEVDLNSVTAPATHTVTFKVKIN